MQLADAPQRCAQPPQLKGSVCTSTQALLQSVCAVTQLEVHAPLLQT
jgi:hypothetical protein